MDQHFTEEELSLLQGKFTSLARKYNSTTTYVKMIEYGDRKLNTRLSQRIFSDVRQLVELFKPLSEKELAKLKNKINV